VEHVAGLIWRLLEERYPAAAAWWGRPVAAWWPPWSADAFAREEQLWLRVAEAGETEGTEAARRWARQARHAAVRLRGGVFERADLPLWRILATIQTWTERGYRPTVGDIGELATFIEDAARVTGVDGWTRMRVDALVPAVQRHLRRLAKPDGADPVGWTVAVDRAVTALTRFAETVRLKRAPPPVPWVSRMPEPEPFEAERREIDAQASEAVPFSAPLGRQSVLRLEAAALEETIREAIRAGHEGRTPSGPVRSLAGVIEHLWAERWDSLDLVLADPRALPAAVDWVVALLAMEPGPEQAGWRWIALARRSLGVADAALWLGGEEAESVRRWLKRYIGDARAAWWVAWLASEPGWALSRRLWRELNGLDAGPLASWPKLLTINPADQPPYWQWSWEPHQPAAEGGRAVGGPGPS
jgi:hypothetical protein